jgi:hypothetical protein
MEVAMGDYEADAGSGDALRAHVEAIRTESARIGTQALRAAALDARKRLAQRPEPLPERIAALDSQVAARLNERGEPLEPFDGAATGWRFVLRRAVGARCRLLRVG